MFAIKTLSARKNQRRTFFSPSHVHPKKTCEIRTVNYTTCCLCLCRQNLLAKIFRLTRVITKKPCRLLWPTFSHRQQHWKKKISFSFYREYNKQKTNKKWTRLITKATCFGNHKILDYSNAWMANWNETDWSWLVGIWNEVEMS